MTINAVSYGSENDHGAVDLLQRRGSGMVFQVQPGAPITTTFQGPAQGQDDVVVRCSVDSPGVPDAGSYQIDIGWASATLLPASSIDSVDVP